MKVSIVLRTYNEQKHLNELLDGIRQQRGEGLEIETVIVDSGSTDDTLKIAAKYPVKVVPIKKEEFSFGRSLNLGCAAATGNSQSFAGSTLLKVPGPEVKVASIAVPLMFP